MNVQETLRQLVRIDSVSARSNTPIIDYLEERVRTAGLNVERLTYMDAAGVTKIDLIARSGLTGPNEPVELALVGHTDTVPYAADWADALNLVEKEGRLFARGACDTKGFIAAALTAVEAVNLSHLKRPIALIFTADEETGCMGAKKLAQARPFAVRNAIVGEPTSLQPMRAGKGYCLAEITVNGLEGHSAYPAVGASAIYSAAHLVSEIERISKNLETEQHTGFEPPFTTINVGLINGGSAKNIIPGECRFTLEWRPVPNQAPERVLQLVQHAIDAEMERTKGINVELVPTRIDGGMETPSDSPLVLFLEEATGKAAGTIAFGTEAPQMIELGADAVVLGPGDIRVAHRTGEYVPVEELERCVKVLSQAIERFCM